MRQLFEAKFSQSDLYWFHTIQESLPSAEIINWRSDIVLEANPDKKETEMILGKFIAAYLEMGMDLSLIKMFFLE